MRHTGTAKQVLVPYLSVAHNDMRRRSSENSCVRAWRVIVLALCRGGVSYSCAGV